MEYGQIVTLSSEWILENIMSVLTALLLLMIGWFLSGFLSRGACNLLPKTGRFDSTITPLLSEIVRYGVLILTVVIVLSQFGIRTASILAVLGAAGLAVALALQGTLSNIAAGVMLIWLRPFSVGEYIDAEGIAGTVVEIGLFGTRLRTYDGVYVFAPNSKLWDAKIINFTRETSRMVEVKLGIGYESDIAAARAALLSAAEDPRILTAPAPSVFISDLGPIAVEITIRVWVMGSDWWDVKIGLTEKGKAAIEAAGIRIPYSKIDVEALDTAG